MYTHTQTHMYIEECTPIHTHAHIQCSQLPKITVIYTHTHTVFTVASWHTTVYMSASPPPATRRRVDRCLKWPVRPWTCVRTVNRHDRWTVKWYVVLFLTLAYIRVIEFIEVPRCGYLFLSGRDLYRHGAALGTRPVLEWYTCVTQVRVLERYHFVSWNTNKNILKLVIFYLMKTTFLMLLIHIIIELILLHRIKAYQLKI